jgi:hypothetical protein
MKLDLYTKGILTVIALLLAVIVVKPLVSPDITARAQQGSLAGVQMAVAGSSLVFLDPRAGEVWEYSLLQSGRPTQRLQLSALGQPMELLPGR